MELHGTAASAGVGVGKAVVLRPAALDFAHVGPRSPQAERARLDEAAAVFTQRSRALAQAAREKAGAHQAEILEGQLVMFADPGLQSQLQARLAGGESAEAAVDGVCRGFMDLFTATGDPLMAQRAADVDDLRRRLLALLLHEEEPDLSSLPPGSVLVVDELTPSMATALDLTRVTALVAQAGGYTSHAAILARAMGLPAVLGVPNALDAIPSGAVLAVDGETGTVAVDPPAQALAAWEEKRAAQQADRGALDAFRGKPTRTADGRQVRLLGNIGTPAEAEAAAAQDSEGIGLFRTEFLFMGREQLPGEEEQFEAYRSVAQRFPQGEVVLRTLDAGGDKDVPALALPKEDNPFLGHRAVRLCLDRQKLFAVQLRAVLRASAFGPVRVMLPLVTRLSELRAAKDLLAEQKAALDRAGLPYDHDLPLGVMIETPAAVLLADLLAQEADFFSIGTNDLTQYVMCADRGNPNVAAIGSPFDPAVLRAVRRVVEAGHAAGIPVGMCGEAAAEPKLIPLWLAFGLDEFSVSPNSVLRTRREIARWDALSARRLADAALALDTEPAVRSCLAAHPTFSREKK